MRTTWAFVAVIMTLAPRVIYASEPKIAYVNMQEVLNNVNEGKTAKAKLKKEFEKKQQRLDALQKELKKDKDEFDKKASMMKPDVRAQKQEALQKKFMELQQTYMQLQKELIDEESKVTQGIAGKIRKIVGKIGDKEGYTMVLDIGDTVLYYKRHHDITDQVVTAYNKQYKR